MSKQTWDIFCQVIDNFGDIGVCWRLARQLANEHNLHVRLWVDDLLSFKSICPAVDLIKNQQVEGVDIFEWDTPFSAPKEAADVVIEAFACELPAIYIQQMVTSRNQGNTPIWLNLEYLSAERWVEDCHRLSSIHPDSGLEKTFFFPGFTAKTGGLLHEGALQQRRLNFLQDPNAQQTLLTTLGVTLSPGSRLISLFAYENSSIDSLLEAWKSDSTPIHCLVPAEKIVSSIEQHFGRSLSVGQSIQEGNLTLSVIPFISQPEYDQLLWLCDLNFVRGEDSFVRAQLAGRPMVWHIYPQDDDAHIQKLKAFLKLYTQDLVAPLDQQLSHLWERWNTYQDMAQSWAFLSTHFDQFDQHSQAWSDTLFKQNDLAQNLLYFCTKKTIENS